MRYVIDGVRPYTRLVWRPCYSFRSCLSHFMNILAFYCPVLQDERIYDLMRVGWSSWYLPGKVLLWPAAMFGQAFWNLKTLFGVTVRELPCGGPDQLHGVLRERIWADRPLFLFVNGRPVRDGDTVDFLDERDHDTFVGYGFDSGRNAVLLLNNHRDASGWCPIHVLEDRLAGNQVHDLRVPPDCEMPTEEALASFLLSRVRTGLGCEPGIPMDLLATDHKPGTVYGPGGIRAFAELSRYGRGEETLQQGAFRVCQGLLMLLQERNIFLSIVKEFLRPDDGGAQAGVLRGWGRLEREWERVARLAARIHMTGQAGLVAEVQDRLRSVADSEELMLFEFQDYLSGYLVSSRRSETCDATGQDCRLNAAPAAS